MLDLFESFAERVDCPPFFRPVLRKLVPFAALPLLVTATREWVEIHRLAGDLGVEAGELTRLAQDLFLR